MHWLRRLWAFMRREPVLAILVAALLVLQGGHPRAWSSLPALIDTQTIMTLAGLLVLTGALEHSGILNRIAHRLVHHVHSERSLALVLVALAAALSTVLTNDVALFVVIPLILTLQRLVALPLRRLVIFTALAVNAGSVLTPFGNPQNLFLWQRSGVSFGHFVLTLAPLCLVLMGILFGLTFCTFQAKPLDLSDDSALVSADYRQAGVAVALFIAFVLLADAHHAGIALLCAGGVFLLWRPRVVLRIDWVLLLIFILMFMVLRSAAALPWILAIPGRLNLDIPWHAYAAGAVLSQGISNVPAAILLAEFSRNWRALAYGVSVGGFGLIQGSLANLIAMRLAKERHFLWAFHRISIPFWGISLVAGGVLLRLFQA